MLSRPRGMSGLCQAYHGETAHLKLPQLSSVWGFVLGFRVSGSRFEANLARRHAGFKHWVL